MNALAQQLLGVAKGYLGPAAQTFLSAELRALGINANTVTPDHVADLSSRVQTRAARAMGEDRAAELAAALAACAAKPVIKAQGGGHRLASDAAAKLFAIGKLRQSETAYRELVEKHGDLDSYRGLARAQAALEDPGAAIATLRDAAARYAASGDRNAAVMLLAEAVALVPTDLAAHRRLAAALANQGDLVGAVEEYARFVDVALAQHDPRRALMELTYGRETLGDLPELLKIVDRVTAQAARAVPLAQNAPAPKPLTPPTLTPQARPPLATPPPPPVRSVIPQPPRPAPALTQAAPTPTNVKGHPLNDRLHTPSSDGKTRPDASHTAVVLKGAKTVTHAEQGDLTGPVNLLERAGLSKNGHKSATTSDRPARPPRPPIDLERELAMLVPSGNGIEAAMIAASRAAVLTGARDTRATTAALDAARRLLGLGKLQSASDVLLDYIGHGFTDREAQRLLIEVDCAIGRRDYAKEKCQLLSYAYRLDGRAEVAEDVERLARII